MRRSLLGRLRTAVEAVAAVAATPRTEVWLPVKDGGGMVPGRYPEPDGSPRLRLASKTVWDARPVTSFAGW